ncbi:MAG: ATP-binding cassette domain-containing protein [Cryomorphaceae bacterium]|nr:ATP-binding cassette domain-containing protein [Cryomorphaceae bacterium]
MLSINNLTLHFGQRTLFNGVNLFVGERECLGLTGKNGAGKSTLLRCIAGKVAASEGNISLPRDTTIGFLEQEMHHNDDRTVMEEASAAFEEIQRLERLIEAYTKEITERTDYESEDFQRTIDRLSEANDRLNLLGGANMQERTQRILQGLGFLATDMDRKLREFSGGWKMRVELAKLLLRNPDLLLLDEPTNHLDIESIEWLEEFLKTYAGAIILISHDKAFLDALTKRTVEITSSRVYDFKGNYSKYIAWRAEEIERQEQAFKNQQKYIEDTQKLIDKFRAKKNKAAFAQSLIKKLDKLERLEPDEFENASLNFRFPPAPRSGKVVFTAEQLKKSFGDLDVFENIDIIVGRQEKVALVGKNGAGKSTFSRILIGKETFEGMFQIGHNVEIGYYAQNQADELNPEKSVFETLDDEAQGDIRKNLRALLGAFLFSGEDVDKKVKVLSGGEKARLALCKLLLQPYNFLILDEPTNHLDMRSKDVLKSALQAYDGTMLIVSHDRDFLAELTEMVYEVTPTGLKQYIGDIRHFLNQRKAQSIAAYEADKQHQKRSETVIEEPKKAVLSHAEKKEQERERRIARNRVTKLETRIEEIEAEIAKLDQQMLEIDFTDPALSEKVLGEYNALKTKLADVVSSWEEAEEIASKLETE